MYFDKDEEIQQEAKDDPDNKDCLVRIYLGERESIRQQSESYDTLRNFPLRLNMMEDLENRSLAAGEGNGDRSSHNALAGTGGRHGRGVCTRELRNVGWRTAEGIR